MSKVFVSHRGADHSQSEKLALELRRAGHNVWLDYWQINVGDSIVDRINEGLSGSTFLVLCLSSEGMSTWMNREWMSALANQLEGQGVRLIPVRLTGGELPGILRDLRFADLTRDWDAGVQELLKAIK